VLTVLCGFAWVTVNSGGNKHMLVVQFVEESGSINVLKL